MHAEGQKRWSVLNNSKHVSGSDLKRNIDCQCTLITERMVSKRIWDKDLLFMFQRLPDPNTNPVQITQPLKPEANIIQRPRYGCLWVGKYFNSRKGSMSSIEIEEACIKWGELTIFFQVKCVAGSVVIRLENWINQDF